MGVRGLTSYIAYKAKLYLEPYELHDCNLVIDGDNLAYNLYRQSSECNSAFGGDYDAYYRTVNIFFEILFKCNIKPFVLMDGAYESRKMKTVEKRVRSRIAAGKYINPATNDRYVYPLMMREVFIAAIKDCGDRVQFMRCLFEADDELAILARKMNCPLLSFDSDFYIHNVKYIPLNTLNINILVKKEKVSQNKSTNLKHSLASNVKKRMINNKPLKIANMEDRSVPSKQKTIRYLYCCIYKIENLTSKRRINKNLLPLFAALLGNDYIHVSNFRKFYANLGMRSCPRMSRQQKRIRNILNWLKHETMESALEKITNRMKKQQRDRLLAQINRAIKGYNVKESKAFKYFGLKEENSENEEESNEEDTEESDEDDTGEDVSENESEEGEELETGSETDQDQQKSDEDNAEDLSENENEDGEEFEIESDADQQESDEDNAEDLSENENEDGEEFETKSDADQQESDEDNAEDLSENENEDEEEFEIESDADQQESDESEVEVEVENSMFPSWLERRINSGDLPRFIIDIFHSHLYINNPQIENFLFEDCNQIAIPILMHIYGLITYPETKELRYLTRVVRVMNVHYKHLKPTASPYPFDPSITDLEALKAIFLNSNINCEELFEELKKIPSHLRLYLLAIVYWSQNTKHADILHFYSLIICLAILRAVDKIEIRNLNLLHKKFGNLIRNMKKLKEQPDLKEESSSVSKISKAKLIEQKAEERTKDLPIEVKIKFIPKITSILVLERFLKFFNVREDFRKRHNDFSSTILHGFSEFQSVVYFIDALNALVNKPFESIKISQLYNGTFLYNIYTTLKGRLDVDYYIKNFILNDSSIIFDYYEMFIEWSKKFVKFFEKEKTQSKGKQKKNTKKYNPNNTETNNIFINSVEDMIDVNTSDDDEEFNDLNNKFCFLLQK